MGVPNAYSAKILDFITGRAAVPAGPTTVYLVLLKSNPGGDITMDTLDEVTDAGYGRQQINWTAPAIPAEGTGKETASSALATYGPFTAGMASPATHAALVTSLTGTTGEVRYTFTLDQIVQAAVGESTQVLPSALAIAMDEAAA